MDNRKNQITWGARLLYGIGIVQAMLSVIGMILGWGDTGEVLRCICSLALSIGYLYILCHDYGDSIR